MSRVARRSLLWTALGAAVLGTAVVLVNWPRSDRPTAESIAKSEEPERRDERDPPVGDAEPVPRRVVAVPVIEVVDAVDGSPLPEATLTRIPPGVAPRTLVEPILATAD